MLTLLAVVTSVPATAQIETVRVSINPYLSYAPLFIAQREGFFADQGLVVELVELRHSSLWLVPLIRGDLDVGAGPITPGIFNAIARGANVRIVAGKELYDPSSDCTFQGIVVSRALANEAGDEAGALLRGKRVSLEQDSIYGYFLHSITKQAGISDEDVELSPLPAAAELQALVSGQIDAFNCAEPWLQRALDSNQVVLKFSAKQALPGFQPGILAFGPSLLSERPGVGRRFLIAYLRGVRAYAEGKTDRNLNHLVGFQGLDRELLARCCWPSFDPAGRLNLEELNRFQAWLVERGLLDRELAASEYFDPGPLAEVSAVGRPPK